MAPLDGDSDRVDGPAEWIPSQTELDELMRAGRSAARVILRPGHLKMVDDVVAQSLLLLVLRDRGLRSDAERCAWIARVGHNLALAVLVDPDALPLPLDLKGSEDVRLRSRATAQLVWQRRDRLQRLLPTLEPALTPFQGHVLHGLMELKSQKAIARCLGVTPKEVRRARAAIVRQARRMLRRPAPLPPSSG